MQAIDKGYCSACCRESECPGSCALRSLPASGPCRAFPARESIAPQTLYMRTNPRKTREMGGSSQALHARAPTDQRRYGLLFSRLDVQRTARSPSTDHGSQTNAKYQPGRRPMPTGGSVKGADQHGAKGGKQVTNGLGHTG